MTDLTLQFTEAGLDALLSAQAQGLRGQITHMAFGDKAYQPSPTQTTLQHECERVAISDYQGDAQTLRMAGVFNGELEYPIREIGIFLADGTLLGVYSQPDKTLGYRSPVTRVVQWFTLNIAALPSDSVTVQIGTDSLNLVIDEELATLATAQIDTMHRQVQQLFRLNQLSRQVQ